MEKKKRKASNKRSGFFVVVFFVPLFLNHRRLHRHPPKKKKNVDISTKNEKIIKIHGEEQKLKVVQWREGARGGKKNGSAVSCNQKQVTRPYHNQRWETSSVRYRATQSAHS